MRPARKGMVTRVNFYKHYLGDFHRDTGHLSLTERGAYLALIHHYYATETPLPDDHQTLCRIAGAFTKPERDAVKVAAAFFEKRENMLWHKRIEAELEKQAGRCDKNRVIALAREERKRNKNRAQDVPPKHHEDITNRATNVPRTLHQNSTIPEPEPEPLNTSLSNSDEGDVDKSNPKSVEIAEMLGRHGIPDVSPKHPELLGLMAKGVDLSMFEDAAKKSKGKRNRFAYLVTVLVNQLQGAKAIDDLPDAKTEPWHDSREGIEDMGEQLNLGRWSQQPDSRGIIEHWPAYKARVMNAFEARYGQEIAA